MVDVSLREDMRCTAARYWDLYFDPDWTRTLLIDGLGFAECRLDPTVETETEIKRHMFVIPKVALPKAVVKVIGDRFGYDEDGTFDKATETWRYRTKLSVLSEKILMGGEMRMEDVGEGRSQRVSKLYCEVKIFGIGGLIEKAAEKGMRDGWADSHRWINGWLAKNPPP